MGIEAYESCERQCGEISIPFPFGTTQGCSLNEDFLITCRDSQPFLGLTDTRILNISVDGTLRVGTWPAYDCYAEAKPTRVSLWEQHFIFPISYTQNKFTAIGCDTNAVISGMETKSYATGCISYCENIVDMINASCTGMGCCQTSLPTEAMEFSIEISSFFNHQIVQDFNPCSYAFLVDVNSYNFSTLDLARLPDDDYPIVFPLVLDWAIRNQTCDDAIKNKDDDFACKAYNSTCYDSHNGPGYLCMCHPGFYGNPYIQNGCQDVDECKMASLNQCTNGCANIIGNYNCYCPKGYQGDGRKDGVGCVIRDRSSFHAQNILIIGGSISFGLLFLSIGIIIMGVHRRSILKLRKEYFKQNGGFLLQKLLLSKSKHSEDAAAKIISEEELNKATDNYNKNMIIGQGGFGVVYKGTLSDNTIVAIKRSKAIDKTQIEQFVNEVIVLTQVYHPNVVKLMGCCLETSVPLLVYEFITNATLFHHLHSPNRVNSLPWATRLRIAEETASALAYMHSMQIIHRDVKSSNILLDDEFTSKVSDFGVSRLVPFDQEEISTLVQGTLGYMDPEYFQSGLLTEKSDVYSFGVVLVELLTGKKAICSECQEKSLALYFLSSFKTNNLFDILEDKVKQEGTKTQIKRLAAIARTSLSLEGERRPTMKQIMEDLHLLRHSTN
ncbi:wall-associated receptor kinase 5-like [Euphorbia lathyris]|uniref:wall-associated receptor kinase 5-like n=1 Tax=Euphorbia lathyris TaxID=212925 RepID=UPI0033138705